MNIKLSNLLKYQILFFLSFLMLNAFAQSELTFQEIDNIAKSKTLEIFDTNCRKYGLTFFQGTSKSYIKSVEYARNFKKPNGKNQIITSKACIFGYSQILDNFKEMPKKKNISYKSLVFLFVNYDDYLNKIKLEIAKIENFPPADIRPFEDGLESFYRFPNYYIHIVEYTTPRIIDDITRPKEFKIQYHFY